MFFYSLSDVFCISLSVNLIAALMLLCLYYLHCVKQYVNQLNIICSHLNCHIKCTKCAHNDKKYEKISIFCFVLVFYV